MIFAGCLQKKKKRNMRMLLSRNLFWLFFTSGNFNLPLWLMGQSEHRRVRFNLLILSKSLWYLEKMCDANSQPAHWVSGHICPCLLWKSALYHGTPQDGVRSQTLWFLHVLLVGCNAGCIISRFGGWKVTVFPGRNMNSCWGLCAWGVAAHLFQALVC